VGVKPHPLLRMGPLYVPPLFASAAASLRHGRCHGGGGTRKRIQIDVHCGSADSFPI
jgi:hypothetical protein